MSDSITFLGWTDEVTTCDLCGKKGLKSTAALDVDGETVFYGCVCAARALAGRTTEKLTAAKVRRLTEQAHDDQVKCAIAFDQGLNFRALEAERIEREAFRNFVADAGREYVSKLDHNSDTYRHAEFHCRTADGAYSMGLFKVFGSLAAARAAFEVK